MDEAWAGRINIRLICEVNPTPFLGRSLFEAPSNLIRLRVRARPWIGRTFAWGLAPGSGGGIIVGARIWL